MSFLIILLSGSNFSFFIYFTQYNIKEQIDRIMESIKNVVKIGLILCKYNVETLRYKNFVGEFQDVKLPIS